MSILLLLHYWQAIVQEPSYCESQPTYVPGKDLHLLSDHSAIKSQIQQYAFKIHKKYGYASLSGYYYSFLCTQSSKSSGSRKFYGPAFLQLWPGFFGILQVDGEGQVQVICIRLLRYKHYAVIAEGSWLCGQT